jgi:hypothetical protein
MEAVVTTRTAARHKVHLRRALDAKPGQDKPALFVQIVTDAHGTGARLAWGHAELPDPVHYPDFKVLRRFACYPVQADGTVPVAAPEPAPWPFPVSAHTEVD